MKRNGYELKVRITSKYLFGFPIKTVQGQMLMEEMGYEGMFKSSE